jgi:type III secretion protein N (ATPase)
VSKADSTSGVPDRLRGHLSPTSLSRSVGRVCASRGLTISAHVPGARRGDWVRIQRREGEPLDAEVIAFDGELCTLMPLGELRGVGVDDAVHVQGAHFRVALAESCLGRVLDGVGRPIDSGPALAGELWAIERAAPSAYERPRIERVFETGVRAIDALCTIGEGQRVGLFAPAGAGKTTLLARIARAASADVIVVCLVGERGRELRDLLERSLDAQTRARSVVVCATSDAPALERVKSVHLATSIAEYFRARGQRVLLLVDSLTRLVRAGRDVGLSVGELPARRGFPPSAFAALAPLLERAGLSAQGSITAFYTVLVEGNDLDEPVADEVRGLLDAHLVLDRGLAERAHHPALDVPRSLSRLMDELVPGPQREAARTLRALLARHAEKRDLVLLGAHQPGNDALLDRALHLLPDIERFLQQPMAEVASFAQSQEQLLRLMR